MYVNRTCNVTAAASGQLPPLAVFTPDDDDRMMAPEREQIMSGTATTPAVNGVHHTAYRCRDAEETRAFYEDKLGLPLKIALEIDEEPSTGNPLKYMHLFFDIGSLSDSETEFLAFFDLPDTPATDETFAEKWGFDLHLALRVADHAALDAWKARLEAADVPVKGPIDHGICSSIYFTDPNGYVMEFTTESDAQKAVVAQEVAEARDNLAKWNAWKATR